METLSRLFMSSFLFGRTTNSNANHSILFSKSASLHHPPVFTPLRNSTVSVLKSPSPASASARAEEDVLREFFRDRQLNGDVITKFSDIFFQRGMMRFIDDEAVNVDYSFQPTEEALTDEPDEGFLKLTTTQEWLMGETSAPINRKPTYEFHFLRANGGLTDSTSDIRNQGMIGKEEGSSTSLYMKL